MYYPNTISAIHIPGENSEVEKLIDMFEKNGITSSWLNVADDIEDKIKIVKNYARLKYKNINLRI